MSSNSREGINAGFVDADKHDFKLGLGSDLIDSVPTEFITAQPVLQHLLNDLGISLIDIRGLTRPLSQDYEAGAYSYAP